MGDLQLACNAQAHSRFSQKLPPRLGEQVDTVKVFRSFAPDEPHVLSNPTPASILGAVLAYGFPYVVPCSLNMPAACLS